MTKRKTLIHAHIFYPDIWPEILSCIENCLAESAPPRSVSLVLTYPETHPELKDILIPAVNRLKPSLKDSEVVPVPNCGYDIAPFLIEVLNRRTLDDYDYIIKLHTKRNVDTWLNFRAYRGAAWRKRLLAFAATRKAMRHSLTAFERYPKLGLISDSSLISYGGTDYCTAAIRRECDFVRTLGLHPRAAVFVPGSIFMVRAGLLKPFAQRYGWKDFAPITSVTAHVDGLPHQLERAFGAVVFAQGYAVSAGTFPPALAVFGYRLRTAAFRLLRTLSSNVRRLIGDSLFTRLVGG